MAKLWTDDLFAAEDDETGIMRSGFALALLCMVAMRQEPVRVAEAARCFGTTESIVMVAVEASQWMSNYCGDDGLDYIEIDGE